MIYLIKPCTFSLFVWCYLTFRWYLVTWSWQNYPVYSTICSDFKNDTRTVLIVRDVTTSPMKWKLNSDQLVLKSSCECDWVQADRLYLVLILRRRTEAENWEEESDISRQSSFKAAQSFLIDRPETVDQLLLGENRLWNVQVPEHIYTES